MICPSCSTWNRDEALFCKYCGGDLSKVPRPATPSPPPPAVPSPAPPAVPPPPHITPRPVRVRVWWHGLGVFVILAAFFMVLDASATGRLTWSLVVVLSIAFIIGGVTILQYLASPDRRDRRPFLAGAALVAAAVLLLPIAVALQSSPTTVETFTVPSDPFVNTVDLHVSEDTGRIAVQFAADPPFLVQARVTHIGGLFSSHYPGDLTATNTTSGRILTFTVATKSTTNFFFLGGHEIEVTVNANLAVSMQLSSATGNIAVDVPAGVVVATPGILASVTTGNVAVSAHDAAFVSGTSVQATSTTGSVTITIAQSSLHAGTVSVQGTSTTGSVTLGFTGSANAAAKVVSSVTTGSIHFDSAKYSGASETLLYAPSSAAYDAAATKFDVTLRSTTGSINIG